MTGPVRPGTGIYVTAGAVTMMPMMPARMMAMAVMPRVPTPKPDLVVRVGRVKTASAEENSGPHQQ
ncbi:MAG: hypothetical protein ACYS29_18555 [Planctomycetota bacterium]